MQELRASSLFSLARFRSSSVGIYARVIFFPLAWIKPLHSDSLLDFLQLFECWLISTLAFTVLVALSFI